MIGKFVGYNWVVVGLTDNDNVMFAGGRPFPKKEGFTPSTADKLGVWSIWV